MRIWTLGVSVLVHVTTITAIVLAPLFATGALPAPRQLTRFIEVVAAPLPDPPLQTVHRQAPVPTAPREAFPIGEPDAVLPEPVTEPIGDPVGDSLALHAPGGSGTGIQVASVPEPPVVAQPPPLVRAGGVIVPPQKLHHVPPQYPAIALAARVDGVVILDAIIGTDGLVQDVRVLRSRPLLDQAAVDAVRQWRFSPTLLNGMPVRVAMTVTVAFKLQ